MESKSDSNKILELQKQLAAAERLLREKQIQIEFKEKLLELAGKELGIDLKKEYDIKKSKGSASIDKK